MNNPSVGDILALDIIGDINGNQELVQSWQFRVDDDAGFVAQGVVDELRELVEAILNLVEGFITVNAIFRRIRAKNITTGEATQIIELTSNHPGTAAGYSAPPGDCILFAFRTNVPNVLLKKFIGPPAVGQIDGAGHVAAATLVSAAGAVANLLAPITTTAGEYTYGAYSPKVAAFVEPTGAYVPAEFAYQRRRRFGTGS